MIGLPCHSQRHVTEINTVSFQLSYLEPQKFEMFDVLEFREWKVAGSEFSASFGKQYCCVSAIRRADTV